MLLLAAGAALLAGCGGRAPDGAGRAAGGGASGAASASRAAGAAATASRSDGSIAPAAAAGAIREGTGAGSSLPTGGTASAGASATPASPGGQGGAGDGAETAAGRGTPAAPARGAATGPTQAYVAFVTGRVTASGGAAGDPLRVADPISAGMSLASGPSSAAEIRIGSLMDIGMGERTRITLARLDLPASGGSGPQRLIASFDLEAGVMLARVGGSLVAAFTTGDSSTGGAAERGGTPASNGASPPSEPPMTMEISTPELFVTSTWGSFLARDDLTSFTCAVGAGRVWILPRSLVYTDLVAKLRDARVVDLLDSLLARSMALDAGQEISIPYAGLRALDSSGASIRALLEANVSQDRFPQTAIEELTALVAKAGAALPAAIGEPAALDPSLRSELVPSAVAPLHMVPAASSTNSASSRTATASAASGDGSGTAATANSQGSPIARQLLKEAERIFSSPPSQGAAGAKPEAPATGSSPPSPTAASTSDRGGGAPSSSPAQSGKASAGPTPPTPPTPPTAPTMP